MRERERKGRERGREVQGRIFPPVKKETPWVRVIWAGEAVEGREEDNNAVFGTHDLPGGGGGGGRGRGGRWTGVELPGGQLRAGGEYCRGAQGKLTKRRRWQGGPRRPC